MTQELLLGPVRTGRRKHVEWSDALGDTICRRVADGELLEMLCRKKGFPSAIIVRKWMRTRPDFADKLRGARLAGGRLPDTRGPISTYNEEAADEIFERLCEGESMNQICRDPAMPSVSTVQNWRRANGQFAAALRVAREIQAERFCELGWELATEAIPGTAYLTHVRLTQLRWMAGVMAPQTYRLKLQEPEIQREKTVLVKTFILENDPVTGEKKVIGLIPNPVTGLVERDDDPGWRRPEGCIVMPP